MVSAVSTGARHQKNDAGLGSASAFGYRTVRVVNQRQDFIFLKGMSV
jgi:hypothetical protein